MGMSPGRSGRRKAMRRIPVVLAASLLAAALAPLPVAAEVDEATRAARWDELRRTIFGNRTVEDGAGLVSRKRSVRMASEERALAVRSGAHPGPTQVPPGGDPLWPRASRTGRSVRRLWRRVHHRSPAPIRQGVAE